MMSNLQNYVDAEDNHMFPDTVLKINEHKTVIHVGSSYTVILLISYM